MKKQFSKLNITSLSFLIVCVLAASPAYAIFGKLSTTLKALYTLNGSTPSGRASVNQSKYPSVPGALSISVSNVRVTDGTVLPVSISDCPWYGPVAYLKIVGATASLSTYLPANCQVGRLSTITVAAPDGTILLKGGSPWKI
jgi:hypothetical protein